MQKYELVKYSKVFAATIAAVVVFAYIWKHSRVVGSILLFLAICGFAYVGMDWDYWSQYFFADPDYY